MARSRTHPNPPGRSIRDFWVLSNQILEYSNRGVLREQFQEEVSRTILKFSGCEEVELWLREHGQYFRGVAIQDPAGGNRCEILSYPIDEQGQLIREAQPVPILVDQGEKVLLGRTDLGPSFTTPRGGLWTGRTARLPRKYRMAFGEKDHRFLSFALIPVRVDSRPLGLLVLKSKAAQFFSREEIDLYEHLSQSLGIALMHRNAQVELRERVKELTCLYGMARLLTLPGITLEELLKKIVELLPPAWLYPEIASARIVFDGTIYPSSHLGEGVAWQKAMIRVNGFPRGSLEVAYREKKPELDEGPFLHEERHLLDTVAQELGNILKQKETENEQARLQEQLRHADRLATIGQLAAGLAHEINEPLGNILGFAGLAQKCPALPSQARQDLGKITTAALHAREIIRKMLLFARQMPPTKTWVNFNQLIQEGLLFFETRGAKEGITILCNLSADLPPLQADGSQLHQVLVNLVVNALQAMPQGGTLRIQTLAQREDVILVVEDTGIGIPPEHLSKIFTPFFTTKDIGQGTGLGLPVVHGIVSAHGGTIQVESRPGKGTRFTIRLPVKKNGESPSKD